MTKDYRKISKGYLELYQAGQTLEEIGDQHGVKHQNVRHSITAHHNAEYKAIRLERLSRKAFAVELNEGGVSTRQIARAANVTYQLVDSWLRCERRESIRYLRSIGCTQCNIRSWAKGLCRNCYELAHRRGVAHLYVYSCDGRAVIQKRQRPIKIGTKRGRRRASRQLAVLREGLHIKIIATSHEITEGAVRKSLLRYKPEEYKRLVKKTGPRRVTPPLQVDVTHTTC